MKTNLNPLVTITILLFFCALTRCLGQGTLQITFDGPPVLPPNAQFAVTNYNESGVSFRSISQSTPAQFTRNNTADSGYPDDGSAYLQANGGPDILNFNFTDGSIFGLVSVDLAEYSTLFQEPVTVEFIGFHPDGSTVTQSFTTDGIIDGTGPLADFQTFNFTGFNDLTHVEIPGPSDGDPYSMDNLVFSVPEPSEFALGALGALVLGFRRWQKLIQRKSSSSGAIVKRELS
jgi:hypothetical protein